MGTVVSLFRTISTPRVTSLVGDPPVRAAPPRVVRVARPNTIDYVYVVSEEMNIARGT
jgi:hypothetical protein